MVANLSAHKRGWDARWKTYSNWAEKGQRIKDRLLYLVDEDTAAFNAIIDAFRLPKGTAEEGQLRSEAIQQATKKAIEVPFEVMQEAFKAFEMLEAMAEKGNPNSVSDAGVGALCIRAAVHAAFLNVQINAPGLKDKAFIAATLKEGKRLCRETDRQEKAIRKVVEAKIAEG